MKKALLHICLFAIPFLTFGQEQLVSMGEGYGNQVFYSLSTGESVTYPLTTWDVAFSVDRFDASVFVNEAVNNSRSNPIPEVEAFFTVATDFETADTMDIIERIFNPEVSWSQGAFNAMLNPEDPFDLGWGAYNPVNNTVSSSKIFFVKLRSGTYKKFEIMSLAGGEYTVRYANLDNTEEMMHTINKDDFAGKTLAYLSIEQDSVMDLEPASWDMTFTRYWTPLEDTPGVDYMVTGIITNTGVQVAQVDDVEDPETTAFADYEASLTDSTLYLIGHDWKSFDLGSFSWSIPNKVFFVKAAASDSVWKLTFLDFEGSGTGVTALKRTFAGVISTSTSIGNTFEQVSSYRVYPNPSTGAFTVDFDLSQNISEARLDIRNHLGQSIYQEQINVLS
ncbi:MAG: hypothetical protein AAF824_16890, partial [Bacteroidota bacterium]